MTWREGELLGFDLECTSALPDTAIPVAFALVAIGDGEVLSRRYALVDPGIEIPAESIAVHGITTEECRERGGALGVSLVGICNQLATASRAGTPIVACNAAYDLTVLDRCFRREFGVDPFYEGWAGPVIDPLVLDRHCDTYRKGSRKLADLCAHYDVPMGKAHHAGSDAEAAVRVSIAIAEKYAEVDHADPELLTVLQQGWHREFINHLSDYFVSQGREPIPESERAWPLRPAEERTAS
jgi:DNA polymerase-3 subunit epsilon